MHVNILPVTAEDIARMRKERGLHRISSSGFRSSTSRRRSEPTLSRGARREEDPFGDSPKDLLHSLWAARVVHAVPGPDAYKQSDGSQKRRVMVNGRWCEPEDRRELMPGDGRRRGSSKDLDSLWIGHGLQGVHEVGV